MSIRLQAALAVWIGLAGGLGPARADEAKSPTCSMETIETTPAAAIDPCTDKLTKPDLSAAERAAIFYLRARGYHRSGRLSLAGQDYDVAIKLAPEQADYYVHRANVEYRQGHVTEAFSDLTQALTLDPRNAIAFRMLGTAYSDAGKIDQALDFYSQALTIDAREPYALMYRSDLLLRLHRFDEAFRDADALVDIPAAVINRLGYVNERATIEDFHVIALTHRAEMFLKLGKPAEAGRDFDAAVAAKWSPEALTPRGEYRLAQPGQAETALKDLEESARLDPGSYRAQYDRGLALMMLKRFDSAVVVFGLAAALRPDTGMALLMRARSLRAVDRTDEAISDVEHAIANDAYAARTLHRSLVDAGYTTDGRSAPLGPAEQHAAIQACMLDPACN